MSTITIQLEATAALAGELTLLAAQLADEQPLCRESGAVLRAALDGRTGVHAAACATSWAELTGVLAERCAVTGRALGDAVDAYRDAEGQRAAGIATVGRSGRGPR
jgi:hypothetical protein